MGKMSQNLFSAPVVIGALGLNTVNIVCGMVLIYDHSKCYNCMHLTNFNKSFWKQSRSRSPDF